VVSEAAKRLKDAIDVFIREEGDDAHLGEVVDQLRNVTKALGESKEGEDSPGHRAAMDAAESEKRAAPNTPGKSFENIETVKDAKEEPEKGKPSDKDRSALLEEARRRFRKAKVGSP